MDNEINTHTRELIQKALEYYDLHYIKLVKFQQKIHKSELIDHNILLYDINNNILYEGKYQHILQMYKFGIYYKYAWAWILNNDKRTLYYAKKLLLYGIDLNEEDGLLRAILTTSALEKKITFLHM
jgi:hypothetical protein